MDTSNIKNIQWPQYSFDRIFIINAGTAFQPLILLMYVFKNSKKMDQIAPFGFDLNKNIYLICNFAA